MIRKFAFVILDDSDKIIDRFNLDYVDGLSGLGFKLELSKIETELEDYITKIVQSKQNIVLTVHHLRGYIAGTTLKLWLAKHINDCLCIEYQTREKTSYIEGAIIECGETELNEYKALEQRITFQPTTPFFEKIDNDVYIRHSGEGKVYSFSYPYRYGQALILNNEIINSYIKDIPIIVTLYGSISNPTIKLLDEKGNTYNEVRFEGIDIREGEKLVINSAQKKMFIESANGSKLDCFNKLNGFYDYYLRAKPLEKSRIEFSLDVSDTGYLVASRRQYRL